MTVLQKARSGLEVFPDGSMGFFLLNGTIHVFGANAGRTQGLLNADSNMLSTNLHRVQGKKQIRYGHRGAFDQPNWRATSYVGGSF
jgi:hypothetical protein